MAKLNLTKTIEQAQKCILPGYGMSCSTMQELYEKNYNNPWGMICDSFFFGYAQATKAAKAEQRRAAV